LLSDAGRAVQEIGLLDAGLLGKRPGSPFAENLRALVIYLRFTRGIAFERLARLLSDILGLEISEGALVDMLEAAREAFAFTFDYQETQTDFWRRPSSAVWRSTVCARMEGKH
jgi:Transposase IS66 family